MPNVYYKLDKTLRCVNCQEDVPIENLVRVDLGNERATLFCPQCNCFLGLLENSKNVKIKNEVTRK